MDFSKLTEWLKLSPKYLFPICIVTGFALFAPANTLEIFGINLLVAQIRPYLGIVFLLSASLLVTNLFTSLYSWAQNKYQRTLKLKAWQKKLHSLTAEEKYILQHFINNQTQSQYLPMDNGVVNGLEIKKVIFRASDIGNLDEWAYNIQPWAWEYLNNHPELLTLNQNEMLNDENRRSRSRRYPR
jgi:hypothetical protein